jgi:hypothetical protein
VAERTVGIDFYRVVIPPGAPSFESFLTGAGDLPADDARTLTVRGAPMRLQELSSTEVRYEGDMIRIRMEEVPDRASLDGDVEPFDLEDDEGMGEHTAFLYYVPYKLLVVQRNRFAVSASALIAYIDQATGFNGPTVLEVVVEPETMAQFGRLMEVRQFEVSVAGIHNPATVRQHNPGVGVRKMTELLHAFESPSARLYFSMGHESGSLPLGRVRDTARRLMRLDRDTPANVRKIEISGYMAGDEYVVLDLMKDRMVESAAIRLTNDRRLPYSRRAAALRSAFTRRRDQLHALFGEDE